MEYVRGFDAQILEALDSPHPDVGYHAVVAAGNWSVKAAWSYVVDVVASEDTEKSLLLAAIDAVASIRPSDRSTSSLTSWTPATKTSSLRSMKPWPWRNHRQARNEPARLARFALPSR